jgi:CspA family cold shock protein
VTNPLPFVINLAAATDKPLCVSRYHRDARKPAASPSYFYNAGCRKFRRDVGLRGPIKHAPFPPATGKIAILVPAKNVVPCMPILLPIQFMMDNKTTGTVKFFNADKGFGFIKHDDSNKETFVHASGLIDQIKENDHVEFDLQNGKKGLNAVNVKLIR